MRKPVYQAIASRVSAIENCRKIQQTTTLANEKERLDSVIELHREALRAIERDCLPSGSGIDTATRIGEDSRSDRLVLRLSFHHMTEGMYDGWTDHSVIVMPSLIFRFELRITGRDRNDIKEYLLQTYYEALSAETDL